MKKYYNCPVTEVVNVNAAYNVCAVSSTDSFTIVDPTEDPGNLINAESGR